MSTDSGAPRSAAPIHRTPPAAPPRAAVGPPGARSSSRASVSTQSGSRPGSSAGAAPYAHPRHGGAFNEGDECMEEEDPTARVTFEPEGGDQEAERGGRVGHPISAKASIRGAAHAAQATAPAAPPAATAEELLAENLQQRLAAMFLARQGRAPLPSGSGSSIPSPAGGLRVVGLSFIGLLGLDPGLCWMEVCIARPRKRPASAPARLHATFPGPCRSYHRHPSPGHPLASISTVLTRPSAVRASCLPFPCALCAALVRRIERPIWPSGQLPGRQEQRGRWPQRGRRRRRRLGRPDGRWRPRARPFRPLRRPSHAAAEQQQKQQQRRRRAQEGASGDLGGGYDACAAGEPREPPGGVVGRRREGFRRSLQCMPVFIEKSWDRVMLVCMFARMCAMCGERQRVIHDALITLVCVASFGC